MQFKTAKIYFIGGGVCMKYEINDQTLAIIPYSNSKTKIIEADDEYVVDSTPYSIMEHSCEYFGSSLMGRVNGTRSVLGTIYKAPIFVEETKKLIFFPTEAIDSDNVSWVSYRNISNVEKFNNKSIVKFNNGTAVIIDCPYFSIKNQIFRCNMLESISNSRKLSVKKDD